MIKYTQAVGFLKLLLQSVVLSGQGVLKKMYLFGSVGTYGEGKDLDVILEVDNETFERYCSRCVAVLHGVNPFSDDLLQPFHGLAWEYFSPKGARTEVALEAIGVDFERFMKTVLAGLPGEIDPADLDVVCLPVGWDSPDSEAYKRLQGAMLQSHDPYFLVRAAGSCAEITA